YGWRAVDEGRVRRTVESVVRIGHREQIVHRALYDGVGRVRRFLPVAKVRRDECLGCCRQDQRQPERRHQQHPHEGNNQCDAVLASEPSFRLSATTRLHRKLTTTGDTEDTEDQSQSDTACPLCPTCPRASSGCCGEAVCVHV